MKKVIVLFTIGILVFIASCHSQNEEKEVVSMLNEFYIAYNTIFAESGLDVLKVRSFICP
jgi:hypothetical protein